MSYILEDSEHLATSLLPLPYAQLTRLLALVFLLVMPLAYVQNLGLLVIPLSFTANVVYFLIDECSGQMEQPFGNDVNDVAIEKTLRCQSHRSRHNSGHCASPVTLPSILCPLSSALSPPIASSYLIV